MLSFNTAPCLRLRAIRGLLKADDLRPVRSQRPDVTPRFQRNSRQAEPFTTHLTFAERNVPEPFAVTIKNAQIAGTYQVDGFMLTVRSVYGTRRVPLGLDDPKTLAKAVTRAVLRDLHAVPFNPAKVGLNVPGRLSIHRPTNDNRVFHVSSL